MLGGSQKLFVCAVVAVQALLLIAAYPAAALLNLWPEEIVQASGSDIDVGDYSVPSYVDWNNDGAPDLVVGEKTADSKGKVRIYLNVGSANAPAFSTDAAYCFYAQAGGADLSLNATGCMGCFPRVVDWNNDAKKDLIVGDAYGYVTLFQNNGTDTNPTFFPGVRLKVGGADIDVGDRACPTIVDWNNDSKKDLVVGALDGNIRLFINEGTDVVPNFPAQVLVQDQDTGLALDVPSDRSSPEMGDFDDDGDKDLLAGNTNGQLILYHNVGTDAAPAFATSSSEYVTSNGVPIDLVPSRSRPSACDWTGNGTTDVLIGASDGLVHLYQTFTPPYLVSAVSRKSHLGAGDLDIDLPLDGVGSESRCFDDTRIVLTFNEAVHIDCANILIPGPADCASVTEVAAGEYEVLVSGTADQSCLVLIVIGVTDLEGTAMTGDNDVYAVLLCGDATGDGAVAQDDVDTIVLAGGPVGPGTAHCDLDGSGQIDVTDSDMAQIRIGNTATCTDDPPELLAAVSRRNHGLAVDLDIDLPLDPPESAGIETRLGGPTRIVLTFSEAVQIDCANVALSGSSTCTGVADLGGGVYEVGLAATPDEVCLAITLLGVIDMAGVPLTGDNDVHISVLAADVNSDYKSDLVDVALCKSMNGATLDPTTTRLDINVDGQIDLTDMAAAKNENGGAASCP